jgi:hypothetical protein
MDGSRKKHREREALRASFHVVTKTTIPKHLLLEAIFAASTASPQRRKPLGLSCICGTDESVP